MQSIERMVAVACVCAVMVSLVVAQTSPKQEFRGAWIATVTNLDWPSSRGLSTAAQQNELITILNSLKAAGFNAVVFQVRTECDALYNSPYDPWSYWLTGQQGTAPNPYYDPLEFAVREAHKRGMELHAWFNPYRAVRNVSGTYPPAANHVSVIHDTDWVLTFPTANIKIVNPGLPEVRDYVARVVTDIVRRYDIDGIHADDYFYPYPAGSFSGVTTEDTATFSQYPRGHTDIKEWRRDNVNLLLKQIYDSVQVVKPWVKFGMSPFGIWKNGVPSGIFGLDAYNVIACDAIAWLQGRYIDYLAPQLYWQFGGGQDYGTLQPWWADSVAANARHLYTGNAAYRINTSFGPPSELANQIALNRSNPKVQGSIQFRANNIRDNIGGGVNIDGWTDLLKKEVYRYPAVIPAMNWKESIPPNIPQNLRVDSSSNVYVLHWDAPGPAADTDTASRYLVYRFTGADSSDRQNSRNLIALEGMTTSTPSGRVDTIGVSYSFAVSALDRNNNESGLSNLVTFGSPVSAPVPLTPADSGILVRNGSIRWAKVGGASSYLVDVSRSADFAADSLVATIPTTDTAAALTILETERTYFWRVIAGGQAGTSGYSSIFRVLTRWPLPPELVSPLAATNVSRTPTLIWKRGGGTSFTVQILDGTTSAVVVNATVAETTFTSSQQLTANKIYGWRVRASNAYGESDWSAEGRFRTESATLAEREEGIPTSYELSQNYPNPFNPETNIRFALPEYSRAILTVYDVLGRQIVTLVDEDLPPGRYSALFDASHLPSGTYVYVLTAGSSRSAKKMLLLR